MLERLFLEAHGNTKVNILLELCPNINSLILSTQKLLTRCTLLVELFPSPLFERK